MIQYKQSPFLNSSSFVESLKLVGGWKKSLLIMLLANSYHIKTPKNVTNTIKTIPVAFTGDGAPENLTL